MCVHTDWEMSALQLLEGLGYSNHWAPPDTTIRVCTITAVLSLSHTSYSYWVNEAQRSSPTSLFLSCLKSPFHHSNAAVWLFSGSPVHRREVLWKAPCQLCWLCSSLHSWALSRRRCEASRWWEHVWLGWSHGLVFLGSQGRFIPCGDQINSQQPQSWRCTVCSPLVLMLLVVASERWIRGPKQAF